MREPPFWWRATGIEARLLSPVAAVYGAVAAYRLARKGRRAGVPVVCIGNPTAGGAGKTPLALTVARLLAAAGERPVFLSRGYGGRQAGPLFVHAKRHCAVEVGDEPLLLARVAPTIVARDRVKGARAALAAGASVIVMDDGFQNPSLCKDVAILVVDARRGLGNAKVLPAGPLRAPLKTQFAHAHAVVVVGTGSGASEVVGAASARGIAVFAARLIPDRDAVAALKGSRIFAFAGIGDPEKFFATLDASRLTVVSKLPFADHHRYTTREAKALCDLADRDGLVLVTTEKDLMRMPEDHASSQLRRRAHALPVTLALDDEAAFKSFLFERLSAAPRTSSI